MGDNHETFWCHECDMSVSVVPCPSSETQLCPHCFNDLLELMDSSSSSSSSFYSDNQPHDNYLLNSPFLQRLIRHLSTHPINHDDHLLPSGSGSAVVPPPSSLPASKASVDAIPTLKITSSMLDLDPLLLCAVCKDPFLHSVDAKQLPCKHLYHPHCILPWLSSHSSCPLCRFQLPTDTHQHHHHQQRFHDDADDYDWFMEYGSYGTSLRLSYIAAANGIGTYMPPNLPDLDSPAAPNASANIANAHSSLNGNL